MWSGLCWILNTFWKVVRKYLLISSWLIKSIKFHTNTNYKKNIRPFSKIALEHFSIHPLSWSGLNVLLERTGIFCSFHSKCSENTDRIGPAVRSMNWNLINISILHAATHSNGAKNCQLCDGFNWAMKRWEIFLVQFLFFDWIKTRRELKRQ